jgi:ketosteroid isomerase-like protein
MATANVELVRRAVEAFNREDRGWVREMAAPDFEYVPSGAIPGLAGVYRGMEEFEHGFLDRLWAEFDEAHYEILEIVDAGDRVLASYTLRGRGKQSGAEVAWDVWQVWTMRDGKVVHGQGFTSRDQALEAAGLRP